MNSCRCCDSGGLSNVVDIYDTDNDTWDTATLSQARYDLSATSAGGRVFFGGGWCSGGPSDVVDIYTPQNYDTITSSKAFTLDDHTTVAGRMQLSAPGSLSLGTFNLDVGSMSGDAPIDLGPGRLTAGADNSTATTYSGDISGAGSLAKTGTGTLILTGTVSSPLVVDQGRVETGPGALLTGNLTIAAAGQFQNNGGTVSIADLDNSGVLAGNVRIGGDFLNRSSGSVRVGAGEKVLIQSPAQSNAGLIRVIGALGSQAELECAGPFTNSAGDSLIAARNAILSFNGGLDNWGAMAFSYGATDVFGDVTNTGSITIGGGGGVTFYDDVKQEGSLEVSAAGYTHSSAVFFGAFTGSGGFTGGGDVFFLGDLRPGNSPAEVVFDGNVTLGSSTNTLMELAGLTAGDQYDRMVVSGELTLGGSLDVVLLDDFAPRAGNAFDLFDGTILGQFDDVSLPGLDDGLSWNTNNLYTAGLITVVPEPSTFFLLGMAAVGLLGYAWRRRCHRGPLV